MADYNALRATGGTYAPYQRAPQHQPPPFPHQQHMFVPRQNHQLLPYLVQQQMQQQQQQLAPPALQQAAGGSVMGAAITARPSSPTGGGGGKPPVALSWVRAVAMGSWKMDGTTLAGCVDATQDVGFLMLPPSIQRFASAVTGNPIADEPIRNNAANEVNVFIQWLRSACHAEIATAASKVAGGIAAPAGTAEEATNTTDTASMIRAARKVVEPFVKLAASVFVLHVTKMLQGPRAGGSSGTVEDISVLASTAGKAKGKKSQKASSAPPTSILDECTNDTKNLYLKALMSAFDQLQENHVSQRNPQLCGGFPGWDTAIVISFVHVIQDVSQTIEGIEGELLGDIMRNWRKLFVFLQSSDPDVSNENSRRRGALAVVNSLLILLFQQDNTHQCRIILNSIDASEKIAEAQKDPLKSIVSSSSHLVAEMVKFRYYQGRIRLYDRNFEGAFASFAEANRLLPPIVADGPTETGKKNSANAKATTTDSSGLPFLPEGLSHPLAWGTFPAGHSASVAASSPSSSPTTAEPAPIPALMNAAQRDNKLRVTFYQITSAILCGLRVPQHVLMTDPTAAKALCPIIAAIQNGSPAAYTTALDLHGHLLRLRGVYMLLQQGRIYCYLTLLQRVHAAVTAAGKDNSMIPIQLIVDSLSAANHACCDSASEGFLFAAEEHADADHRLVADSVNISNSEVFRMIKKLRVEVDARFETDDVIIWIGRLIARGLVRGYLSYEHKMLVLSKKEPFPSPQYTFNLI